MHFLNEVAKRKASQWERRPRPARGLFSSMKLRSVKLRNPDRSRPRCRASPSSMKLRSVKLRNRGACLAWSRRTVLNEVAKRKASQCGARRPTHQEGGRSSMKLRSVKLRNAVPSVSTIIRPLLNEVAKRKASQSAHTGTRR